MVRKMEKINKTCPKCGFYMTNNNCVKCGYYEGKSISNIERYKNEVSDVQALLKNEYQKIVYNKNLGLLFILGPLYFGYYHCIFFSIIGIILEFSISWILGMSNDGSNIIILFFLIINRTIYVLFGNTVLLKLLNKYISKLKEKHESEYKEKIYNRKAKAIPYLILTMSIYITILVLWLVIYKTYW